MERERYQRAAKLFEAAMAHAGADRDAFLASAANGDDDLLRRVQRMLEYAERVEPTVGMQPIDFRRGESRAAGASVLVGKSVGRFQLVELIGEGGFGAVYKAEQSVPVRRTVAVKVLKFGMDSQHVIVRFDAERQALAMMEHPGIARVIDAGQTDAVDGARPYFVMEFVTGEPITTAANRLGIDLEERLELFCMVCQAVHHAHQRGVIHRDLKPSNILVTVVDGVATPKVIDFGIAKAIHQPLTDAMLVTNQLELLGTPQYMSPEQADADERAIDTRTDVYSLGVVLYELLTGSPPLSEQTLRTASYSQMIALIREHRAERPSVRAAQSSAAGDSSNTTLERDHTSWARRLRGELDWIMLKALDPDRERRYDSAAALAQDIQRFMRHEPVLAGPPGTMYRISKFVRRHRVGVAATVLLALALVGGTVGTTLGMMRASASAKDAYRAADQALKINEFLSDMLLSVDPDRGRGADVRFVEVLENASTDVTERFSGHPQLEAEVRDKLGQVYSKLSMSAESISEFQRALLLYESLYGPDDERSLRCRTYLVGVSIGSSRVVDLATVEDLVNRIERALGQGNPLWVTARKMYAQELSQRRSFEEAQSILQDLYQRAQADGSSEETRLMLLRTIGAVMQRQLDLSSGPERWALANALEPVLRELVARSSRLPDCPINLQLLDQLNFAQVLCLLQRYDEAAETARAVLAASEQRLGACHHLRNKAMHLLSQALVWQGNVSEAADLQLQFLECKRRENIVQLVSAMFESLNFLERGGRLKEAEAIAVELVDRLKEIGGGHGPFELNAAFRAAKFVSMQGRLDEADAQFAILLPRIEEARIDPGMFAGMHACYAAHLVNRGQFALAEEHLQTAAGALSDVRAGTHFLFPDNVIVEFIKLYRSWGKPEKVAEYERLQYEALHPQEWTVNSEP